MLFAITFIIGISVGGFLNFLAYRTPYIFDSAVPGSFCFSCKRTSWTATIIPIFGHFLHKCDCVKCGDEISIRSIMVEVICGVLFVFTYMRHGLGAEFIVLGAAVCLFLLVTIIDLEYGLIHDRILIPTIIFLVFLSPFWPALEIDRPLMGHYGAISSMGNSLLSGGGAFLAFLAVSALYPRGLGGGDVKLAGVLGLLIGFPYILLALWISIVVGGLFSIWLLMSGKQGKGDTIPFGPCLSFGALATLLAGDYLMLAYRELTDIVLAY